MESFNRKRFLQCFDQLTEVDPSCRNHAIDRILTDLTLPSHACELSNLSGAKVSASEEARSDKYTNPLSAQRSYKFRFTVQDNNLLQYTLDRLLRGLKANRKCSRSGFTVALLSVLSLHAENIKWDTLLQASLAYTSAKDCIPSEVKDTLCGRLYALFIIHKSGFFRTPLAIPELETVIQSIWEIYDSKIYFQDAACVLLWLICRDVFRCTKDTELTLRHVGSRLSVVLDPDFVERTLNYSTNENKSGVQMEHGTNNLQIGKSLSGVLPCALFGLYLRLHGEIQSYDKKLLDCTVLEKTPLEAEHVSLVLRYVSCVPNNHPVIGSFFDALLDSVLSNERAEDILRQLWYYINLNMLDVQGGCSTQRAFTGLRLAALLLLKVRHSPDLLHKIFTASGTIFKTLRRYHQSPRNDVMKRIAGYVLQLMVGIFQGNDIPSSPDKTVELGNPIAFDFLIYTDMNRILGGIADPVCLDDGFTSPEAISHVTNKSANSHKVDMCKVKQEEMLSTDTASLKLQTTLILPGSTVVNFIESIASAVEFSPSSLTVFQNLFGSIVRASEEIVATYSEFESMLVDVDITPDLKRINWLLNMFQLCIWAAPKTKRMELLKRFITMSALCVAGPHDGVSTVHISVARLNHKAEEFRAVFVSREPLENLCDKPYSQTPVVDPESGDASNDIFRRLSKQMLNCCIVSLSKVVNGFSNRIGDNLKQESTKIDEVMAVLDLVCNFYAVLDSVANHDVFICKKNDSEMKLPLVDFQRTKGDTNNTSKRFSGSDVRETLAHLSNKLIQGGFMLKKHVLDDARYVFISLYSSTLAVMLLLFMWQDSHLRRLSLGTVPNAEGWVLLPDDKMRVIVSFAELCAVSISTDTLTVDSVLTSILSKSLLSTILSEDSSPAFGLLHAVSKGFWNISKRLISDELRDELLQNSVVDSASYDSSKIDMDESDSGSISENDDDDDESDVSVEGSVKNDGIQALAKGEENDSETDENNVELETDEDEDPGTFDDGSPSKKRPLTSGVEVSEEESDIELSEAAVLDELLKDEESNLEALRQERMKIRSLYDLTPKSLKMKMRSLDLLHSSIPDCTLGPWYLDMVSRLYSSYQVAVSAYNSRSSGGSNDAVTGEYVRKLANVLSEAVRQIVSPHAQNSGRAYSKTQLSDSKGKVKFENKEIMLESLLFLTLQAINGQRLDKTAKLCRQQAVSAFVFSFQVEPMVSGGVAVQSTMVLLVALLSAAMYKNSRIGTNFFVRLANRHPSAFASINMVKIALESKVEFVQSEFLSICTASVNAIAGTKPKRLCRRKCKQCLTAVISDELGISHDLTNDKTKVLSYVTDDLVTSVLQSLPELIARIRTNSEISEISDDINKSNKRPMKLRGVSPQLAKSVGRLVTAIVKSSVTDPKQMKNLQKLKQELTNLMDALCKYQGKMKQLQPIKAAVVQLYHYLGEQYP
ncbi:dna polymerase phi subunit [Babesia caballi]|uniref:Dna polymerase phi subunit n=1 Tax=Babesia caballi TaxID=5871 RepID=A0AAV4M0C9_BABCB|nr:dna polymerase phi subunit [Babesia caballi]